MIVGGLPREYPHFAAERQSLWCGMLTTNYMKLWIHEAAGDPSNATHMGHVAVFDRDLFRSLEVAIAVLEQAGWVIDDLAEFRIVRSTEEDEDPILHQELETARNEGCSYRLEPAAYDSNPPPARKKEMAASLVPTDLLGI
jgi:hypothetical protein